MSIILSHIFSFLIGNIIYIFTYTKYRPKFQWNIIHLLIFGLCVSCSSGWIICAKHQKISSYLFTLDLFVCYIFFYIPPFMLGVKSLKVITIRLLIWWSLILLHAGIFYYWLTPCIKTIHNDRAFVYSHKTILMIYVEIGSYILASIAGFTCVYVPYIFFKVNAKIHDKNLYPQLQRLRQLLECVRQEIEHINDKITDLEEGITMSYKNLISLDTFLSGEITEMEHALEIQTTLHVYKGKIKHALLFVSAGCCFFTLTCTIIRRALYFFLTTKHVHTALSIFGKAQIYIVVFVIFVNAREFFIFTDRVLIFLSAYVDNSFSFIKDMFSKSTIPLAAASFMNIAIPSYIIVLFQWLVLGDESFLLFEHFYALLKPIYDTSFLITAFFTMVFIAIIKEMSQDKI